MLGHDQTSWPWAQREAGHRDRLAPARGPQPRRAPGRRRPRPSPGGSRRSPGRRRSGGRRRQPARPAAAKVVARGGRAAKRRLGLRRAHDRRGDRGQRDPRLAHRAVVDRRRARPLRRPRSPSPAGTRAGCRRCPIRRAGRGTVTGDQQLARPATVRPGPVARSPTGTLRDAPPIARQRDDRAEHDQRARWSRPPARRSSRLPPIVPVQRVAGEPTIADASARAVQPARTSADSASQRVRRQRAQRERRRRSTS